MEITNIWNKLNIQCKKVIVFSILSVLCFGVNAQKSQSINYAQYDEKKLNYGFVLGGHYDNFLINHSGNYLSDLNAPTELRGTGGVGYTLGFVINYHLNDITDLRILPSVGFYERHIKYIDNFTDPLNPEKVDELFESTFIELPLLLKFKSIRRGNTRFYFVGGLKPSIEVGANKSKKKETLLRTQARDVSIELGVGSDLYFPYFKFSPELRFSLGLLNMIERDNNNVSGYVKRMPSYSVSLLFIFE